MVSPSPDFFVNRKFAITGGGGYLGRRIALELVALGAKCVRALDVRKAPPDEFHNFSDRIEYYVVDLTQPETLHGLLDGMDGVFHVASYGMSGREMLETELIRAVNVEGTRLVVDICRKHGVPRLVYTSTTNVVFCGQPILNGDETIPYANSADQVDMYSLTKTEAEKFVLSQDSTSLESSSALQFHTCAIRPAGIYGEGEERHLPRIVNLMRQGLYQFKIGSPDSRVEFVHVDNLVLAHLLAMERLEDGSPVCGQPYFISDGKPVNNFDFFQPLASSLGLSEPRIRFPTWLMLFFAFIIELLHRLLSRWFDFQPLLTRAEVNKVSITHFFSPLKSQTELEYVPQVSPEEGMRRVIEYWQKDPVTVRWRETQSRFFCSQFSSMFRKTIGILSVLALIAVFILDSIPYVKIE